MTHLKVFGSLAYAHIPYEKRHKLDDESVKCIFVGYTDETKGYILYNPKNKNLIIGHDVIFNENDAWNWEIEEKDFPLIVEEEEETSSFDSSLDTPLSTIGSPSLESPPKKFRSLVDIYKSCDFVCFASKPTCFEDAIKENEWNDAMKVELHAIEKNKTWKLVDLPSGKEAIGLKWIYKSKFNANGSLQKYKVRLVAKGYAQIPGVEFFETFSLIARMDTIRIMLAVFAQRGWEIFNLMLNQRF